MQTIKLIASVLVCMCCAIGQLKAQRYFVTNQYVYERYFVNPAAAAFRSDCYSISGYVQNQWLGTDMAPATQMLSFQKAFLSNLGSGTYVYNDRNGYHREIGLQQSLAYNLKLSETRRRRSNLLFGLSLMVAQRSLDMSNYGDAGAVDPVMGGGKISGHEINANTGFIWTINALQLGVSATNILPFHNSLYSNDEEPDLAMDVNFFASSIFQLPERNLYLEPIVFFRRNARNDSRTDFNLKFTMPNPTSSYSVWGALAYRRTIDESIGKSLGAAMTLGIMKNSYLVGVEYQLGLTSARADYGNYYKLIVGYRFCRDRFNDAIPCSSDKDMIKVGRKR
ncbi:MAG: PorP/SprF family type IX secretion system membrane protein [Breznakibacter sp.]